MGSDVRDKEAKTAGDERGSSLPSEQLPSVQQDDEKKNHVQ